MLKLAVVIAVAAMVFLSSVARAGDNLGSACDSQDWLNQRCLIYRGDYCRLPFVLALTHAQAVAKCLQKVQLRGFLVYEAGGYAIYASRDAAVLGWSSDALRVKTPSDEAIALSLRRWNRSNVVLRGRLRLQAGDNVEYWAEFEADSPIRVAGVRGEKL